MLRGRFNQTVWWKERHCKFLKDAGDMATDMNEHPEDKYQSPNFSTRPLLYIFHSDSLASHSPHKSHHQAKHMEKPHAKSALKKFVKVGSESALPWSSAASARRTAKDDVKEQLSADKSKATQKPQAKENTKPVDVKLHTQQRAVKRAMFNYSVATKLYLMEQQKKHKEKLQKMIEEEEIRLLRKEMIPRAQLMPLFDRPFFPQRSSRPLTIPREPAFRMLSSKCWTCMYCTHQLYSFHQHCHPLKPIK